ncbi:MAG TPA: hypothetical protein VFK88_10790 [Gallionella sp.]|nr:hypothetical protein [Gallionella sp.]
MKKFILDRSSAGKCSAVGALLRRDLLAASLGLLLARPALAAVPEAENEAQADTAVATVCATCHGGGSNRGAEVLGLTAESVTMQLTEFMTGKRRRACLRQQPAAA